MNTHQEIAAGADEGCSALLLMSLFHQNRRRTPVLLEGKREYAMFVDILKTYHWVLPVHYYIDQANLLATLKEDVINPAELKAQELKKR
jgi:hypothetical protein